MSPDDVFVKDDDEAEAVGGYRVDAYEVSREQVEQLLAGATLCFCTDAGHSVLVRLQRA